MQDHPNVRALNTILTEDFPFMASQVEKAVEAFGAIFLDEFEDLLGTLLTGPTALRAAVRGYVDFTIDALRLHKRFEKDGVYHVNDYDEVTKNVYHNEDYMQNLYLPGILLSHFLWPHHYRQRKFFECAFLPDVLRGGRARFFDVGIGTGYYSRMMLCAADDMRGHGFDISRSSEQYTLGHLAAYNADTRYEVTLCNVIDAPPAGQAPWLISVEVLEHLPDPPAFLAVLRTMLMEGGKGFITAALNAPNADHIYLYRKPEEVVIQLLAAGFHIEQYHSARAYAAPAPGVPVPEIAAFIVT